MTVVNIIGNDKLMAGAMFFFGKKKNNIRAFKQPVHRAPDFARSSSSSESQFPGHPNQVNIIRSSDLRLMQDMRSSRSSYLLRQLHSTLQEVLPSVTRSLRSYLLCDSVLGYFNGRPPLALIDMYERLFFGQMSLINRQNGGVKIDFVPPVEDEVIFLRLRTSFFQKFNESTLWSQSQL